jgi:cell shape-determining protein MreC
MNLRFKHNFELRRRLVLVVTITIFIVLLTYLNLINTVVSKFELIAVPVSKFNTTIVVRLVKPFRTLASSYRLANRLKQIERQYSSCQSKVTELELLKDENLLMKKIINGSDYDLSEIKVTRPIISLASPAIAGGYDLNLSEGEMITASGMLLGVIGQVEQHYSEVILLSSKQMVPILAKTKSDIKGLVVGDGKRVLFTEIPIETLIQDGEEIYTVGQPGIRQNVYIGKLMSLDNDPSASTKKFLVEQGSSFYELNMVEVNSL